MAPPSIDFAYLQIEVMQVPKSSFNTFLSSKRNLPQHFPQSGPLKVSGD